MSVKLVIVGGVAGGATAAARARRLDESAEIVVLERGPDVSFANCGLPYHVGGEIADRKSLLVQTADGLRSRFRIDIRTRSEAISIDRTSRTVRVRELESGREYDESYDYLLLSPGAAPIRPPIPGIDHPRVLTLRSLGDMDRIKAIVDRGARSAVVVGAGFIGLEMAENLRRRKLEVALVELLPQVLPPLDPEMASRLHQELAANGVDLFLEDGVTAFEDRADGLCVQLKSGRTLSADMAILSVGVRPESSLARDAGLRLNERGAIVVDDHMRTSDERIFAVGDAVEVRDAVFAAPAMIPLAGPANRQARIAVDNIFGRSSRYRGSQGTSIVRVFGVAAGITGASEKTLVARGVAFRKVYTHGRSHAGYFPGSQPLAIKLLFAADDGRVLGAQVVGGDGVDKRLDVLATAIQAGLTVKQLQDAELAYAPQFGSAKDPINIAGYVASNVLHGDDEVIHADELTGELLRASFLLDVRQPAEFEAGAIEGAVNVPLPELRARLNEIPRDRPILVYCAAGQRGYYAARTLRQHGFTCRNLSGGFLTWRSAHAPRPEPKGTLLVPENSARRADAGGVYPAVAAPAAVGVSRETAAAPVGGAAVAQSARQEHVLDVRGLCCPGPIAKVAETARSAPTDTLLHVIADDIGFEADFPVWCRRTGAELLNIRRENGHYVADVVVHPPAARERVSTNAKNALNAASATSSSPHAESVAAAAAVASREKCLVVFSGDLDRVMAAVILANTAASMGDRVTLYFTFWGLAALRKPEPVATRKPLMFRMLGWMLPRGPGKLKLSKMHMAGVGTAMMKSIMRSKGMPELSRMLEDARRNGVRILACSLAMDMLGMSREELIDGVEVGGAGTYLGIASESGVNLFI
jgi:NADPH-dependent 2,4-dienoyl-CoA reductase/sulfur reductase-like enzyme/peroxiredoxin family protein/rhodanese-related sulfurtransferase/TusA-related sulfurtransferase